MIKGRSLGMVLQNLTHDLKDFKELMVLKAPSLDLKLETLTLKLIN